MYENIGLTRVSESLFLSKNILLGRQFGSSKALHLIHKPSDCALTNKTKKVSIDNQILTNQKQLKIVVIAQTPVVGNLKTDNT